MELLGRSCVVVGASRGAGAATAAALSRSGARVAVMGRSTRDLASVRDSLSGDPTAHRAVKCDVTDPASVASAFSGLRDGGVDVLIYAAGIGSFAAIRDTTDEVWNDTLATNLTGLFFCLRAAEPMMNQGGKVVAISSGASKRGISGLGAYCASKWALNGLMETAAAEFEANDVKVSTLVPGSILTDWAGPVADKIARRDKGGDKFLTPEDVADAVVFLLCQSVTAHTAEMNLWPA